MSEPQDVTLLLTAAGNGDGAAASELLPLVYEELRTMAARQLRSERAGHTLQPTALVHEAYLKLVDQSRVQWNGRTHFLGVAAIAMRRILVNHAKARGRAKRGGPPGDRSRLDLDDAVDSLEQRSANLEVLDEALQRLALMDPDQARMVELRFFGGLSVEDTAQVLGVSPRTIHREWDLAKAWLRTEVGNE